MPAELRPFAIFWETTVTGAIRELKRAQPMRQIEMVELMVSTRSFSAGYAKCLIAATPPDQLVEGDRPKDAKSLTTEDIARMENELETFGREFKIIEESHGRNTLNLVVVVGYLRRLLENSRIAKFMAQHYPELLVEFQKTVELKSLDMAQQL